MTKTWDGGDRISGQLRAEAEAKFRKHADIVDRMAALGLLMHGESRRFAAKGLTLSFSVNFDRPMIFISSGLGQAHIWWCYHTFILESWRSSRSGRPVDLMKHDLTGDVDAAAAAVLALLGEGRIHLGTNQCNSGTIVSFDELRQSRLAKTPCLAIPAARSFETLETSSQIREQVKAAARANKPSWWRWMLAD